MTKIPYIYTIGSLALLLGSCSNELSTTPDSDIKEETDMLEVVLMAPTHYGAPLSDLGSSRAYNNHDYDYDYDYDLSTHDKQTLPEGSTLWVYYVDITDQISRDANGNIELPNDLNESNATLRSFMVENSEKFSDRPVLYSCEVDEDGNATYLTSRPLYLKRNGVYLFRTMGPARKLTATNGLYIKNGEYVYSTDDRYQQTEYTILDVDTEIKKIEQLGITNPDEIVLDLHPMIYQVAQLKFTLVSEEIDLTDEEGNVKKDENGNDITYYPVHTIEVTNSGVVITGLQDHYDEETQGSETWNWTLTDNYIKTYPGDVYTYYTLYTPKTLSDHEVVFETAILPVDAVANPIIVEFYLRINGVPTQLQMMLNRKMFLHAYSYHYKGTIKLEGGITVLEWQEVSNTPHEYDMENDGYILDNDKDNRSSQN